MFSAAKNAVKSKIHAYIDQAVTKQLRPFMMEGIGPDGQACSDVVVNEESDISIENMIFRPNAVNDTLMKKNSPFRMSMISAKRVFFDIPWENLMSADACWTLEVEDLNVVGTVHERDGWQIEHLVAAKEAAVQTALATLIKKLKALDAKPKAGGLMDKLKARLMGHINLTLHIKSMHLRLERLSSGGGVGAPPFSVGFVLPSLSVETTLTLDEKKTSMHVGKAGIYCFAGTMHGQPVARTVLDDIRYAPPVATRGEKDAEAEALTKAAIAAVYQVRERMEKIEKDLMDGPDSEWFVLASPLLDPATALGGPTPPGTPGSTPGGPGSTPGGSPSGRSRALSVSGAGGDLPASFRAVMRSDSQHRDAPQKYEYEQPIESVQVEIGKVSLQASDTQLAALLSLSAHSAQFKLWSAYGKTRRALGLPTDGSKAHPKALWRAAATATIASLKKARVGASNLTHTLLNAKAYKTGYVELMQLGLKKSILTASTLTNPAALLRVREAMPSEKAGSLSRLEDVLPIDTLAWCRLVAQNFVKTSAKKDGGGKKKGATSKRAEQASTAGYVNRAVDLRFTLFSMQLLRSLSKVEQAELKEGALRRGTGRGVGLMTLSIRTIRARKRSLVQIGSATSLFIVSIDATDDTYAGPGPSRPTFVKLDGSAPASAEETDMLLGGEVAYVGDIGEELEQRKLAKQSIARRVASSAYNRLRRTETDDGGASGAGSAADAPAPAVVVSMLQAKAETEPDLMGLKVGFGEIVYLPPFWAELEAYLQVLEGVKWSSQLGGTDMLRKKHAKIYRSIDKIMREAWHMPQINFIMPFLELSDQLGLPTWKHKFDAALKGFRFLLRSEKEPFDEELMRIEIPPLKLAKTPKVGGPDKATWQCTFEGMAAPIRAESTVQKGLLQRVLGISTNTFGSNKPASRLQGSRDTLASEVVALRNSVTSLRAELDRAQMTHKVLQSQVVSTGLECELVTGLADAAGVPAPSVGSSLGWNSPGVVAVDAEEKSEEMLKKMNEIEDMLLGVVQWTDSKKNKKPFWKRLPNGKKKGGGNGTMHVATVS